MTPERLFRAREICTAALGLRPDERRAFITDTCAGDSELTTKSLEFLAESPEVSTAEAASGQPRQLGRYRIDSTLGAGGMGVVYLAHDAMLGRRVAIKSLRVEADDSDKVTWLRDRLLREARAAAALAHPGIVGIHDIFEEHGNTYIVMEYAGATNLERLIASEPPEPELILRVVRQTAEALDHAHRHGIVHRDIKPSNLIITGDGSVKIADFGIAKIASSTTQTATGMILGTAQYMAPEQIRAMNVDGRADQFALGVIAYKMLTRRVLFPDADSLPSLSYKICHETPAAPTSVDGTLPKAVDAAIIRALAKDSGERFPTCAAFADALDAAFRQAAAAGAPTVVAPATAFRPKSPWIVSAALAGLVMAGGATAWMVFRQPAPPQKTAIPAPPAKTDTASVAVTPPPPPVDAPPQKKTPVKAEIKTVRKIDTDPAAAYKGPDAGQMVWTGALEPDAALVIRAGDTAISGAPLPGVPVRLEITPAVVETVSPPAAQTRWKTFTLRNTSPRRQTLLIIKWSVVRAR